MNFNIEHPIMDPCELMRSNYHEYLEEEKIDNEEQAVKTLIQFLFHRKDTDKDLVLQSIQLLAEKHAPNEDVSFTEEDLEVVPIRLLYDLQIRHSNEKQAINRHVMNIVRELISQNSEPSKYILESSLKGLIHWTSKPNEIYASTEYLKKINVRRG